MRSIKVTCPYCQKGASLVGGGEIYPHRPDLSHKKFWLCSPCDAYVGVHNTPPYSVPLGTLADARLRRWRRNAHAVFDPLWKGGDMSRSDAYQWLAQEMGISPAECHIAMFDIDLCKKVVELVRKNDDDND